MKYSDYLNQIISNSDSYLFRNWGTQQEHFAIYHTDPDTSRVTMFVRFCVKEGKVIDLFTNLEVSLASEVAIDKFRLVSEKL